MRIKLNTAQTRFWCSVEENVYTLFGAGVGTGKTTAARVIVPKLVKANFGYPGLLVSHVMNHTLTVVIPDTIKYLKAAKLFKRHWKNDRIIECIKDTNIQYGSGDRPDTIEGKDVAWAVGDEIRFWRKEAYGFFTARVRIRAAPMNRIVCLSTLESHWMEDEWRDQPGRHVVYATTYENEQNLRENYIEDQERTLSPQEFKRYVLAQWIASSESIFSDVYDKDICIEPGLYVRGYPVLLGMDFGVVSPACVFVQHFDWCQRHKQKGCIHVIDELVPDNCPLDSLIPLIRKKEREHGYNIREVYVDPAGQQRDQVYGYTCIGRLHEDRFDVYYTTEPKNTNVKNGLSVTSGRLLNARGDRRMFFDESLAQNRRDGSKRCITYSMENYRWVPQKEGQAVKDKPVHDATSHIIDALRYLVIGLYPPMDIL